jgi:hypothetical protein
MLWFLGFDFLGFMGTEILMGLGRMMSWSLVGSGISGRFLFKKLSGWVRKYFWEEMVLITDWVWWLWGWF